MGYDFTFIKLGRRAERSFPILCSFVTEADSAGGLPWEQFRTHLLTEGGRENGRRDSVLVFYSDGGSINFSGDSESIFLDVHTGWRNVLSAFLALLQLDEEVAIFDPQKGDVHDSESFMSEIEKYEK
jgi:hypothetical protein